MTDSQFVGDSMTVKDLASIGAGNLFKLLVVGYSGIAIPASIIRAILAFFEIVPSELNDQSYFGIKGFVVAVIGAPIYVLLMTIATWVFLVIGLKIAKFGLNILKKN